MKRPVQRAEQQEPPSNSSECCEGGEEWLLWLILVTQETSSTIRGATPSNFTKYSLETSSTMRGASEVTFQLHQIMLLPGKMILMINPGLTWNVQYNARSNRSHRPTPANVAKAAKNGFYDWSSSHKKRLVPCAEQQGSPSNFDKYCACREKWLSWLILVTHETSSNVRSNRSHPPTSPVAHETSFTLRGPTEVTLQHHQILRLLRKMAFQNSREIFRSAGPADPSMVRPWTRHRRATEVAFIALRARILYSKIQHLSKVRIKRGDVRKELGRAKCFKTENVSKY